MTIYLPAENNFYEPGTKVKAHFEGKTTYGVLSSANETHHIITIKLPDGKFHHTHKSHVTLDRR